MSEPELCLLFTVDMSKELVFAVSEASWSQDLDERRNDIICCDSICLGRINFVIKLVGDITLQTAGRHVQLHLQSLVAKYVLIISVNLVTHFRQKCCFRVLKIISGFNLWMEQIEINHAQYKVNP